MGNNIRIDLQEVECGAMDWIDLAQSRDRCRAFVDAGMKLGVQKNASIFLAS